MGSVSTKLLKCTHRKTAPIGSHFLWAIDYRTIKKIAGSALWISARGDTVTDLQRVHKTPRRRPAGGPFAGVDTIQASELKPVPPCQA